MRTKSQLGWLNLTHLPILSPPVTAKQRMIPDQSEEGIDGHGRKDSGKRKVLRREWKTPRAEQAVWDQSVTMEKSWVMMTKTGKSLINYKTKLFSSRSWAFNANLYSYARVSRFWSRDLDINIDPT